MFIEVHARASVSAGVVHARDDPTTVAIVDYDVTDRES
jgi:hypothetical protein